MTKFKNKIKKLRLKGKSITIRKYIELTTKTYISMTRQSELKSINKEESAMLNRIKSAVYMLFLDFVNYKCDAELKNIFGADYSFLIEDTHINDVLDTKISDPLKMAEYSYFIMRRSSERYICQVLLQTLIKDLKQK